MSQIYRSFIKNNATTAVSHLLIYAQGIFLIPLIVKSVGIQIYGGYILVMSFLNFLNGISAFGIGFTFRRFVPSTQGRRKKQELFYKQMWPHLFSMLLIIVIVQLTSSEIKNAIFSEIDFSFILLSCYLLLYVLFGQVADYFRYTHRIGYFNLGTVLFAYINVGLLFFVIVNKISIDINRLIFVKIVALVIIIVPMLYMLFREIGIRIAVLNLKELKYDIRLGFPLLLQYLVHFILSGSDRYIISYYLGLQEVGYYNIGYSLGSLIAFYPAITGVALLPLLSKTFDNNDENASKVMANYTIKFFLIMAIPFIFGSYLLGERIITALTNHDVAANAHLIVPVIAFGNLFYGLGIIISNLLFVKEKTHIIFKASVVAATINLLSNAVIMYFYRDIKVAAMTTLLSYLISFGYLYILSVKEWKINYGLGIVMKSLLSSIIMSLGIMTIFVLFGANHNLVTLFVSMVAGILFYMTSLIMLGALKKEIPYLRSMMIPHFKRKLR